MIIHPLCELMQFGGGDTQSLRAVPPDIWNNLIVHISGKAAKIVFQMRRGFT
jgi:hypothetical protein